MGSQIIYEMKKLILNMNWKLPIKKPQYQEVHLIAHLARMQLTAHLVRMLLKSCLKTFKIPHLKRGSSQTFHPMPWRLRVKMEMPNLCNLRENLKNQPGALSTLAMIQMRAGTSILMKPRIQIMRNTVKLNLVLVAGV